MMIKKRKLKKYIKIKEIIQNSRKRNIIVHFASVTTPCKQNAFFRIYAIVALPLHKIV
jgi:hypothetical protein